MLILDRNLEVSRIQTFTKSLHNVISLYKISQTEIDIYTTNLKVKTNLHLENRLAQFF